MKKKYITPAVEIEQLQTSEGLLISASDGNGGTLFGNNDKGTSDSGFTGQETKFSGNWSDIWDE